MEWYCWLVIALGVMLLIVAACAAGGYALYSMAVVRKKKNASLGQMSGTGWAKYSEFIHSGKEQLEALAHENVTVESRDGLRLAAKFYEVKGAKRTVILVHGYRSEGCFDFGVFAQRYLGNKYNVLLIDQRSHGSSEGEYICYGVKERFDVATWAHYLVERFPKYSIYLHGLSMGAATVLMASGLPLVENVKAVIADCGFTSPVDEFAHVMRTSFKLPTFPLLNFASLFCKKLADFDIDEYSTLDAMKVNDLPIMFIHGEKDNFVPFWMSQAAYEACKTEKLFLTSPESTHATTYFDDPEGVAAAVFGFLSKY